MTPTRFGKYFLGALLAALFSFHTALAFAGGDEVLLKDGTVLRGTVVKQMPGKVVVIKTTTGTTESIPWDDVKRVSLGEEPASIPNSSQPKQTNTESKPEEPAAPAFPAFFDVGLRTGFALPFGNIGDNASASDLFTGKIPFWVESNWHFSRHISVGAAIELSPILTSSEDGKGLCSSPNILYGGTPIRRQVSSCSALNYRIAFQFLFYPSPDSNWSPFLGIGMGYEWLHAAKKDSLTYRSTFTGSVESNATDTSATLKGLEIVHLQAGLMKNMGNLSVGPFIGLSLGMFLYQTGTTKVQRNNASREYEIDSTLSDPPVHEWLTLGVRGTYQIGP